MGQMNEYFFITMTKDRMLAKVHCTNLYHEIAKKISIEEIKQFLKENHIVHGIDQHVVHLLTTKLDTNQFPLVIAKGELPVHGVDGKVTFMFDFNPKVDRSSDWNFREVMRIPSVNKGERLATITMPLDGKPGKNVIGNLVPARPGKQAPIRAGKHVVYHEETKSFFAAEGGQVDLRGRFLDVVSVYEVNGTLSMKTGNLDFVGSITIHGDVPTGFEVKAGGDIRIFGIVEAAIIEAKGSVFISEGIAGLEKGQIKADENIHIGYINQAIVHAEKSIYVENSIIHSECVARENIVCQQGNIIGGSSSAGKMIEAKDVGNRLNTKTTVHLGENKLIAEEIDMLSKKQKELKNTLMKLEKIGKSLESNEKSQDVQARITLLRQRKSYEQTNKQLATVNEELSKRTAYLGSEKEAMLIVRNNLHPNTIVAFGKYRGKINKTNQYVKVQLEDNEISVQALK